VHGQLVTILPRHKANEAKGNEQKNMPNLVDWQGGSALPMVSQRTLERRLHSSGLKEVVILSFFC
jgi:hypothetical protein